MLYNLGIGAKRTDLKWVLYVPYDPRPVLPAGKEGVFSRMNESQKLTFMFFPLLQRGQ